MESAQHSLPELFCQLGLPDEPGAIDAFISNHAPLPELLSLPDAPFWTPAQAAFLRDGWKDDADWAEVIDQLNVRLRG